MDQNRRLDPGPAFERGQGKKEEEETHDSWTAAQGTSFAILGTGWTIVSGVAAPGLQAGDEKPCMQVLKLGRRNLEP